MAVPCFDVWQTLRNVFASKQSMNGIQTMLQQMASDFKDTTLLGNFVCVLACLIDRLVG